MNNYQYLSNDIALTTLYDAFLILIDSYKKDKGTWKSYFVFLNNKEIRSPLQLRSCLILLSFIISLVVSYCVLPIRYAI